MKKIKVLSGLMAVLMGILSFSSLPSVDAKGLDAKDIYCVEVSKEEKQKLEEVLEKIKDEAKIKESNPKSVSFVAKVRDYLKSICTYSMASTVLLGMIGKLCKEDTDFCKDCKKLEKNAVVLATFTSLSNVALKIFF